MRSGGTSLRQCKLAYLRICKTLRFYGATFFAAQNTRNPKMPSEVVLAVSYKGLSIVSVENEAALADFLYVDVASWGYSANSFVFVVARAGGEETEHVLKTTAVSLFSLFCDVVCHFTFLTGFLPSCSFCDLFPDLRLLVAIFFLPGQAYQRYHHSLRQVHRHADTPLIRATTSQSVNTNTNSHPTSADGALAPVHL